MMAKVNVVREMLSAGGEELSALVAWIGVFMQKLITIAY
jgi:hypothetical protein